jgi:hypothetical protein
VGNQADKPLSLASQWPHHSLLADAHQGIEIIRHNYPVVANAVNRAAFQKKT